MHISSVAIRAFNHDVSQGGFDDPPLKGGTINRSITLTFYSSLYSVAQPANSSNKPPLDHHLLITRQSCNKLPSSADIYLQLPLNLSLLLPNPIPLIYNP